MTSYSGGCTHVKRATSFLAFICIHCAQGAGAAPQQAPIAAGASDGEQCCSLAMSLLGLCTCYLITYVHP